MATETTNYKLKKPAPEDFADIADINGNMDIIDAELKKRATLDDSGKVPDAQLPSMDYIPTSQKGKASGVATLDTSGKVPTAQLPSMDYVPTSEKGKASGVATLDTSGKVPTAQIPSLSYIPTSQKAKAGGVASLGSDGKVPTAQLPTMGVPPQIIVTVASGSTVTCVSNGVTLTATSEGTVTFDLPDYGTWTLTATLNGQTATDSVIVDDVKQYTVTMAYFSATLRVTSESGATVTATGPKTYSATVPSSGVVDIAIKAAGTYTVKASKDGETTDPVTVNVTTSGNLYTCECLFFSPTLANNTWAQIAKASETGKASQLWQVGDTKDITIGSETITLAIMGFNHDDKADGSGKAGITFGMKHLMANTRQMNSSNTNSGGFTGSAMYTWLTGTLLPSLPSDLQAVLKSVNKKTSAGSQSSTINTNAMKLFLFSEIEIFGSVTYSKSGEGSQYSYFATAANRIKNLSNGTGSANIWWERSPYASGSTSFCVVSSYGNAANSDAGSSGGVCFGFCV